MDNATGGTLRDAMLLVRELGQRADHELVERFGNPLSSNACVAVLTSLAADGPQRPKQLLADTGFSGAGLAGALDSLEALGLVARRTGVMEHDRRSVLVVLTRAGLRTETEMREVIDRHVLAAQVELKAIRDALDEFVETTNPSDAVPPRHALGRVGQELAKLGIAVVAALQILDATGAPLDATSANALLVLDRAGQCRPTYLGEVLLLTSGGVTRVLNRLESAGLCTRVYATVSDDRRSSVVSLTDAGHAAVSQILNNVEPLAPTIVRVITDICFLLDI